MHNNFPKIFYFVDNFNKEELEVLNKKIAIIYRNYKKIDLNQIIKLKNFCKKNNKKLYLANNPNLAYKLRFNGAYIPSFNKDLNINKFQNLENFKLIGSAHNIKEINIKLKQGIKCIFLAPLFKTKKNRKFLDIYKFNQLKKFTKLKTIALGGINEKNIARTRFTRSYGIASISFIKNNVKLGKLKTLFYGD